MNLDSWLKIGVWGSLFGLIYFEQARRRHHLLGDCRTAPKPNSLLAAAPQSIVATANILFCACPAKS